MAFKVGGIPQRRASVGAGWQQTMRGTELLCTLDLAQISRSHFAGHWDLKPSKGSEMETTKCQPHETQRFLTDTVRMECAVQHQWLTELQQLEVS